MKCISCGSSADFIYCGQSLCEAHFKEKATEIDKMLRKHKKGFKRLPNDKK